MAEQRRNFQIREGMNVVDRDGNKVGDLETILTEDQTGVSRFFVVKQRLVPVEAIDGVEGDRVKMTVRGDKIQQFPERRGGSTPSADEQRKAYEVINLSGPLTGGEQGGPGGQGRGV